MILLYDLQFFAQEGPGGEKTEPATQKKLDDARKKGQVAKSKEVANGCILLALFLALKIWVPMVGGSLGDLFHGIYEQIPDLYKNVNGYVPETNITSLLYFVLTNILLIIGPIMLLGFLVCFITDLVQVKWHPTGETLRPKFSKLNPISGFKRIISANSLMELVKSIAKIMLIAIVAYNYLQDKGNMIFLLLGTPVATSLPEIGEIVIDLGLRISIVYMLIVAADFIYQKRKFANDMKMTKQEIKDEYKEQEGDPTIKGKQKQRMQEASRRRMMQQLPEADVVITNPTHYAVAIKYDPETAEAPIVLAKGADYLAQRIKETAREYSIEIVENKPLAQMLYRNVDIGQQIPAELYEGVANVLAYVYRLQGKA